MKQNDTENMSTASLVMDYLQMRDIDKKRQVIRDMGPVSIRHIHFLSLLFCIGEPHDRMLFRSILQEFHPEDEVIIDEP